MSRIDKLVSPDIAPLIVHPNGCFIYTPGLPFIEELLPRDRFHIEVQPITGARGTRFDEALALLVGSSTFYSTCMRQAL